MRTLYIVVRNDLKPGLQIPQACHALYEFSRQHPEVLAEWEDYIVVLQVPDELALTALEGKLAKAQLRCKTFSEPDLGHQKTALAVEGKAAPLLSSLPLALKPG